MITTPPDPGPSLDASGVQGLQVNREGGSQANFFGGTHHHGVTALEVAWPVLVGRAPLLADAFQHRSGLRDAIEAALDAGARTLVVTGDGGTGKTQLAAAIFERVRGSVDVAVWASVTSREAAVSVYADAFCALHPARARGDATRDAEAFLTWLDSTERSWVVVLDDVGDPADLVGLWPHGTSGRALITTRRLDDAMIGHGRAVINVGLYSAAESMAYLSQRLDRPGGARDVLHEAEQLAEDLGHLPLALAQAAAVIANDAITCAGYRTLLADRSRTLAEVLPHDPGDGYPRPLACAWSLAIDRADALPPRGLARPLMSVVAVLDPNGVPESVLLTVAVRSFLARAAAETQLSPSAGPSEQVPARDVRRALRNLHRLCLISHDPNCTTRGVRMHALAQRAALERLATPVVTTTAQTAAAALADVWPRVESNPNLAQVLRTNVMTLTTREPDALMDPQVHPVLFRAGRSLGEVGLVAAARDYFTDLCGAAARNLGPDHPDTLRTRHDLAYWQADAGDSAGAADALDQLLTDRQRVLGPDHPDTLATRNNIAHLRASAGNPAGAATAFEQLLVDRLRVLGPDHPDTFTTRHNLARSIGRAGNPAAAATAFQELLADRLRILGPDHPDTLSTRGNLAYWRGDAGDPDVAVADFERLLADRLRVLGPDHPDTLATRHSLAYWRGHAGNPTAAATAYEQLVADRLRVLGPDHPDTLATRHGLANWRGHAGHPADAAAAYEQLGADRLRVLGPDHPDTLTTRANLALWRGSAGNPAGAAADLEQLLTDRLRVLGPDHPDTLTTQTHLADWRRRAAQSR